MRRGRILATVVAGASVMLVTQAAQAATPADELVEICDDLYGELMADGTPSSEPLAACQWDTALIGATADEAWQHATGAGVRVGVIDTGVDTDHPDIAPNLDLEASCSFITSETPVDTRADVEVADGDCSNKAAVEDLDGHGTHVASTIAAPVNGVGIAGVAPDATIVALKTCVVSGYCFYDAVADALRYAGDIGLDVVNLSLFADPYQFYCKSDAEERTILRELERATRYAQQRGVLVVVSAGNDHWDLQHPPETSDSSPNHPAFGEPELRDIGNNCVIAPGELPGVMTVSSMGPIGLADYSSVGMSRVDVTAPGGDYFQATGTVQDAILAAVPEDGAAFAFFDSLVDVFPGLTASDDGATYAYLNGTSMSAPHATGVAALVIENHPGWRGKAVKAAVQRTATQRSCPEPGDVDYYGDEFIEEDGELVENEEFLPCYGNGGRTSYFGHGVVDAAAAARL